MGVVEDAAIGLLPGFDAIEPLSFVARGGRYGLGRRELAFHLIPFGDNFELVVVGVHRPVGAMEIGPEPG